jgi:hypothetical protein
MSLGMRVGTAVLAATLLMGAMPASPTLEFVFEETVTLAVPKTPGATALGGRNIIPITGGTFEGPGIRGTILPGGWDWQLRRADGCTHIKADYMLQTDDGAIINVVNQGVACRGPQGEYLPVRTHPVFEPPLGRYEWLGQSTFVGTLEASGGDGSGPPAAVHIRFYRVR